MFKHLLTFISFCFLVVPATQAGPTPSVGDSAIYYEIGGANSGAQPLSQLRTTPPLRGSANGGLGYSCGSFDPRAGISNTLNNLRNRLVTLPNQLTGLLSALPGYIICRSNNLACQLLQDYTLRAEAGVNLSVKSCEEAQRDASRGKALFEDWITIGKADKWATVSADSTGDVVSAKNQVDSYAGEDGLPWLGGERAGGKDQPPIQTVNDTTIAGYNILLGREPNNLDDASDINSRLSQRFATPQAAADWLVSVTGDEAIVIYQENKNQPSASTSRPGLGLLPKVEDEFETVKTQLDAMLLANRPVNEEELNAISANDIKITRELLGSLASSNNPELFSHKLATEIATARVIDDAFMVRQLLSTGRREANISAAEPAQPAINKSLDDLDSAIKQLTFEKEVRKTLISDTSLSLIQYQQKRAGETSVTPADESTQPLFESSRERQ